MADITAEQQIKERLEREREWAQDRQWARTLGASREMPEEKKIGQHEEPISWFMFFCLMLISLIGDGAELITAGTVGWFVGLAMDGILLVILGFTKSGKKQFRRVLVGLFGELIPVVNILPLRTAFVIWAFIKSRSVIVQRTAHLTGV